MVDYLIFVWWFWGCGVYQSSSSAAVSDRLIFLLVFLSISSVWWIQSGWNEWILAQCRRQREVSKNHTMHLRWRDGEMERCCGLFDG